MQNGLRSIRKHENFGFLSHVSEAALKTALTMQAAAISVIRKPAAGVDTNAAEFLIIFEKSIDKIKMMWYTIVVI
ncbi:MAG: hypothetical protein J6I50_02790 [Clostridia bacterium]|nr:hypothetical protein [Clostridia bacterium]